MISYNPIIQTLTVDSTLHLDVLRLDVLHEHISGNKWFKLKRNLDEARVKKLETILTFGGAFSNHIAATAAACKELKFKSIGIIRGEEKDICNPTLKQARENGMQLHFVSRELYAQKEELFFQKYVEDNFGDCHIIPEGGNNVQGLLGCKEILKAEWHYDYIFCACGTGTTFAGILSSKKPGQVVVGISVLKGENKMTKDVERLLRSSEVLSNKRIRGNEILEKNILDEDCILNTYAFKGYAKYEQHLADFKTMFESVNNFKLDHVYTTKLFFAVFDLLAKEKLRQNSKVLLIHSGGLQGNKGFEERYHLIPSL
ncbi:1-aminocyclopropane-1-carboxylate deaminase [Sphingobacteriaceae bacterium]|nr:1-aminocyclopropane-1-carboxylate deaminase [Sphingobacteriaceae bacterium]